MYMADTKLHNFLSFVAINKFYVFVISSKPCKAIHLLIIHLDDAFVSAVFLASYLSWEIHSFQARFPHYVP